MRKTLTLTTLLTAALAAGPLAQASGAAPLQSMLAALAAAVGSPTAKVVALLKARGFTVRRDDSRWTATLTYPHAYGEPDFSTLKRALAQKCGRPHALARPFLDSPRVDVWQTCQGRVRIALERLQWSQWSGTLKIKISGRVR